MFESCDCRVCQRCQPLSAFCGKQGQKAEMRRSAYCTECGRALAALRMQANVARARSEGVESQDSPIESVTSENLRFWEQGMQSLIFDIEAGYDCSRADSWLPSTLRRWLTKEINSLQTETTESNGTRQHPLNHTHIRAEACPAWLDEIVGGLKEPVKEFSASGKEPDYFLNGASVSKFPNPQWLTLLGSDVCGSTPFNFVCLHCLFMKWGAQY